MAHESIALRSEEDIENAALGVIAISANNHAQEGVCLSITDNGMGMSAEVKDKLFQYGFTTKTDGNGFGLHSAANFVTEHGGVMEITSDDVRQWEIVQQTLTETPDSEQIDNLLSLFSLDSPMDELDQDQQIEKQPSPYRLEWEKTGNSGLATLIQANEQGQPLEKSGNKPCTCLLF